MSIPRDLVNYYTFYCWHCDNTVRVAITTIQDMIASAKEKGWHVNEGITRCPDCLEKKDD